MAKRPSQASISKVMRALAKRRGGRKSPSYQASGRKVAAYRATLDPEQRREQARRAAAARWARKRNMPTPEPEMTREEVERRYRAKDMSDEEYRAALTRLEGKR